MKKLILLTSIALLASCSSTGGNYYATDNYGLISNVGNSLSANKSYSYQHVEMDGELVERFELRHGDCGTDYKSDYTDCGRGKGRQEVDTQTTEHEVIEVLDYTKPNIVWYSYSIYFPKDYENYQRDYNGISTIYGQVKLYGWDMPMWSVKGVEDGLMFEADTSGGTCIIAPWEEVKGRWTNITVRADYDTKHRVNAPNGYMFDPKTDYSYADVWVNGEQVPGCITFQPLLNSWTPGQSRKPDMSNRVHFKHGIYSTFADKYFPPQVVYYKDIKIHK